MLAACKRNHKSCCNSRIHHHGKSEINISENCTEGTIKTKLEKVKQLKIKEIVHFRSLVFDWKYEHYKLYGQQTLPLQCCLVLLARLQSVTMKFIDHLEPLNCNSILLGGRGAVRMEILFANQMTN